MNILIRRVVSDWTCLFDDDYCHRHRYSLGLVLTILAYGLTRDILGSEFSCYFYDAF